MKKGLLLTFHLMLFCSVSIFAQVELYSNDFTGGMGDITVVDLDGLTPATNIAGLTPTGSWTVGTLDAGNGTDLAISTSWYSPAGQSDDWMITPEITLPAEGAALKFDAKAPDPAYPDGYTVYISTTGGTAPADFTTEVFSIAAENSTWTSRWVDLSDYAEENVTFAFRNNSNDQFLLLMDNIWVGVPPALDAKVNSALAAKILPGDTTFDVEIENNGGTEITTATVVITRDGSEILNEQLTGLSIASGTSYTYSMPLTLVEDASTETAFETSVTMVNGVADPDMSNNSASDAFTVRALVPAYAHNDSYGNAVDLHSVLGSGQAVTLDFMASWCGPCESSTPELNNFYINNGEGATTSTVLAVTVEPSDDASAVNNLGWGGTYPKMPYYDDNDLQYVHYTDARTYGAGSNSIPFFLMICPNVESPKDSEVLYYEIGYLAGLEDRFQAELNTCSVVGVNDIKTLKGMSVFPNPASNQLNIDFTLEARTDLSIDIFNTMGQMVHSYSTVSYGEGFHREAMDVSQLANGAYIATIRSNDGVVSTQFNIVK